MPVSIKGTGGGGVTLDAGAAASATTLTLPNVSGTVLQSGTAVTVAQGGTGATSLTANNVILGNGTSAVQVVAPGANGNVLTSNGTTWTSAAPSSGGGQIQTAIFGSSSTWTCPAGVTKALVTCVGGGAGGVYNSYGCGGAVAGNGGGMVVALVTVVPGTVYTVTIGAGGAATTGYTTGYVTGTTGGTTSFGSLVTATGATANSVNPSSAVIYGADVSGSTTGTAMRTTSVYYKGAPSYGAGLLNGTIQNSAAVGGTSAALVWSVSARVAAGAPGDASLPAGGVGGAVLIQYVG